MSVEEQQQQATAEPQVDQVDGEKPFEGQVSEGALPADTSADSDFLAGFDAARGIESEPEPELPKLFAGYTEDQVRALLEKAGEVDKLKERESKVFGTLGALRQAVDALKAQPQQQAAAPVNIALKRLSQEYPEMAASLMEDLKESQFGGGSQFDPSVVDRAIGEKLESVTKTYELKLLSMMHKDWRTIPQSPEFAQWKGGLPPDELQVVNDSWDAISVGESLTKFKAWKETNTQAKQQRQSRLEAAVTPRGTRKPTPSMTEEDAFIAGFKSVRG
jgi:hypothetical protein